MGDVPLAPLIDDLGFDVLLEIIDERLPDR